MYIKVTLDRTALACPRVSRSCNLIRKTMFITWCSSIHKQSWIQQIEQRLVAFLGGESGLYSAFIAGKKYILWPRKVRMMMSATKIKFSDFSLYFITNKLHLHVQIIELFWGFKVWRAKQASLLRADDWNYLLSDLFNFLIPILNSYMNPL